MNELLQETGGTPSAPELSFWARHRRPLWAGTIIVAVLTAAVLTYVLFFRSQNGQPVQQGEVSLQILAPEEVAAGSELSYEINIDNRSNFKLQELSLELFYPRDFTFLDSAPDPQSAGARTFNLADLEPGQEQRLVIVGRLSGNVQELKTLTAKLRYVPEAFASSFVVDASVTTSIAAPELSLRLRAQPQLISGQPLTVEIEVSNVATHPFSDIAVELMYPPRFEFIRSGSLPPSRTTAAGAEWAISGLMPGETKTFAVTGKLSESAGKETFFTAELFLKNASGTRISAGRSFGFVQILPSPLVLFHKIVGGGSGQPILVGQVLNYEVEYENLGEVALQNVTVAVVFETPVFNFNKLRSSTGQLRNNTLIWIPAQAPELLVVPPRGKGKFTFEVAVLESSAFNFQKNPRVLTRVEYTAKELAEPTAGNTLDFKIQTEVSVTANVKIVGGANPPVIGQPTTYRIEFRVHNGVNDVAESVLSAVIPRADFVFVSDSVIPAEEKDNVSFVPIAGSLRWQLNRLFAFTGTFHEPRSLSFELIATPTVQDPVTGQPLLRDVQVQGLDEFTAKKILSNKIDRLVP